MSIVWEDPPKGAHGPGAYVWLDTLAPLTENPQRWAMVRECVSSQTARSLSHNLRRRRNTIPPGQWEFTTRGAKVYARYLGPEDAA